MTTNEMLNTALSIVLDNNLFNKVEGRRNYAIITYDNKFWAVGFGEAKRRGLLCWYLRTMGEHNIHIVAFTYKKDFSHAIEVLTTAGMQRI